MRARFRRGAMAVMLWLVGACSRRQRGLPLDRLGSGYGGWWVPTSLLSAGSVVYSAGIGEDISFDEALIGRAGCSVHAFDPTPRALTYVAARADLPPRFCVHAWGLWDQDAVVKFWAPQDPAHVSHSIGNLQATEVGFDAEVRTLASSMKALGHDHLDLLKLDIEGAEVEVLRQMLATDLRPTVICVELDRPQILTNLGLLWRLRRAGYQLVHLEHRNVTMVQRSALGDGSRGAAPGAIDSD